MSLFKVLYMKEEDYEGKKKKVSRHLHAGLDGSVHDNGMYENVHGHYI